MHGCIAVGDLLVLSARRRRLCTLDVEASDTFSSCYVALGSSARLESSARTERFTAVYPLFSTVRPCLWRPYLWPSPKSFASETCAPADPTADGALPTTPMTLRRNSMSLPASLRASAAGRACRGQRCRSSMLLCHGWKARSTASRSPSRAIATASVHVRSRDVVCQGGGRLRGSQCAHGREAQRGPVDSRSGRRQIEEQRGYSAQAWICQAVLRRVGAHEVEATYVLSAWLLAPFAQVHTPSLPFRTAARLVINRASTLQEHDPQLCVALCSECGVLLR